MTGSDWLAIGVLALCSLLFTGRMLKRLVTALMGFVVGCLLLCLVSLALSQPWCPPAVSAWFDHGTAFRLIHKRLDGWLGRVEPPGRHRPLRRKETPMIAPSQIHAPAEGSAQFEEALRGETLSLRVVICLWPLKRRVCAACRPQRLLPVRTASGEPAFVALVEAVSWRVLRDGLPPCLAGLVLVEATPGARSTP